LLWITTSKGSGDIASCGLVVELVWGRAVLVWIATSKGSDDIASFGLVA
jgi:hypothetical protein